MPKRRKYGTKRPCRPRCRHAERILPLCLRRKHGCLPGRIGRSSARGRREREAVYGRVPAPRRKCTDMPNPPHTEATVVRMRIPGLPRRRMNSPIRQSCVGNPSYRVFGRKYPNPRLWNPLHGGQQHTPLPRRNSRSPCRKRNGLPRQHGTPGRRRARRLRNPLQRQRRHERPDNPRRMGSQDRCSMLSIRRPNRSLGAERTAGTGVASRSTTCSGSQPKNAVR